jgi:hypothetical protein
MKLKHLELLLKVGDCHSPLLELEVLLLHSMLKVDDHVGANVHLLIGAVQLLVGLVPPMLVLSEVAICDLQVTFLV